MVMFSFLFSTGNIRFAQICSKYSKLCVKSDICCLHRLNTQNSMAMFTFFVGEICQLKLKFGTDTNSNMQNWLVVFTFFGLDKKYPFWVNLIKNIKIDSLSQNLFSWLIRICRIQRWCSRFSVFDWKHLV